MAYLALLLFFTQFFGASGHRAVTVASVQPPGGMKFWYSADCITYTSGVCSTPSDGTAITAWADRSGNANNLSKVAGTCTFNTAQINSQPSVNFATSCEFNLGSSVAATAGHLAFIVMKRSDATTKGVMIGGASFAFEWFSAGSGASSGKQQNLNGACGFNGTSGTASADTSWHQMNALYINATSYAFRKDEVSDGSGSIGAGTNMTGALNSVGYGNCEAFPFPGQIAEIIYYDNASVAPLTGTQITQVETYLHNKYGI